MMFPRKIKCIANLVVLQQITNPITQLRPNTYDHDQSLFQVTKSWLEVCRLRARCARYVHVLNRSVISSIKVMEINIFRN